MSFTCSRPFSITVKKPFTLSAYWPFDESYPVTPNPATWTDRVQGIVIDGIESGEYTPGLYNNAKDWLNFTMSATPKLAIDSTKDGFSVWFWMKKTTATDPTQILLMLQSYTAPPDSSYQLTFHFVPGTSLLTCELVTRIDDFTPTDTATVTVTPAWTATWAAQGWCFVCATYTTADQKIRLWTDGGSPTVSAATAPMYDMPDGNVSLVLVGSGLPALDEFGISLVNVLDQARVQALYNSANGITWPAVNNL